MYSCIFLTSYYNRFIDQHYQNNPNLINESYEFQKNKILKTYFGDSDFYSAGLKNFGWQAEDIIVNCLQLQKTWAKENNYSGKYIDIVVEQIKRMRPHVTYLHDLTIISNEFINSIKPYTKLIVGQAGSPILPSIDINLLDIIFSAGLAYIKLFREKGITAYYQPLAFDHRICQLLKYINDKVYPVSFIGGVSPLHKKRIEFINTIYKKIDIDIWGYGKQHLESGLPVNMRHHGEIWGLDMFKILKKSKITLNLHVDAAADYAGNMRLFESTGCGALLITDYKRNLNELFEIGKEVIAYRSSEECAELVKYFLNHPEEAKKIAAAGKRRTLNDHTYMRRMEHTSEIFERHLRYKYEIKSFPATEPISYGHKLIQANQITKQMTNAWKDDTIPVKQRNLVNKGIKEMYKGIIYPEDQVLVNELLPLLNSKFSILEIGCSSGYYYEILAYLLNQRINYTGVDYSEALINMAKDYYPSVPFYVADGAYLPFRTNSFDITISSCILLHTPNYEDHVKETVRVSRKFVIAHRTPVCRKRKTQYMKKFAYGIETVELLFNENEIVSNFLTNRLELIQSIEYHSNKQKDYYEIDYVFQKMKI